MPKKMKLDLKGLKVQSFVTSLEDGDKTKIKGGVSNTMNCPDCTEDCESVTFCGTCGTYCTCIGTCGGATCDTCDSCPATCVPKAQTCDPECY